MKDKNYDSHEKSQYRVILRYTALNRFRKGEKEMVKLSLQHPNY